MPKILTARFVDTVKAHKKDRMEYPDAALPGFALRVTSDGKKSFSYRYRSPNDRKQRRMSWLYPVYTLSEARKEAEAAVRTIGRGEDPAPALLDKDKVLIPGTVNALCDVYVKQHLRKHVRRWKPAEGEIDNHIRPHLGAVQLDKIARAHVRQMIAAIEPKYPVAANRALSRLKAVFNWGLENDLCLEDPTRGIKKPTRERPASRVLDDRELAAVWKACDALAYPARECFRMLALTGQRRDDVRCMAWDEIDIAMRNWVIPAARYKSDRSHLVPLTDTMIELLEKVPLWNQSGYVFSLSAGEVASGNLVKPKRKLDQGSGVTGWTLHDIRRTVRTGLARLGTRPDIAERVIGHSVGGRLGETYDLYTYRDEKQHALETWTAHLLSIIERANRAHN